MEKINAKVCKDLKKCYNDLFIEMTYKTAQARLGATSKQKSNIIYW